MKETKIGDFEETILLIVGILGDDAYAFRIAEEFETQTERAVSIGAVHSTLSRLEDKGFLQSKAGMAESKRGGKPKRFFTITAHGKEALEYNQDMRTKLWNEIPQVAWELKFA